MSDDLDRLIDAIEGEGPSSEFVATLRKRIVAETEASPAVRVPVAEIDVPPSDDRKPRGPAPGAWLVTAAAAAVLIVVAIVVLRGDDDEGTLEIIDQPRVEATEAPVPNPGGADEDDPTFDAAATLITDQVSFGVCGPCPSEQLTLEAGTYRFDTVGTPFSLTLDEMLVVQWNQSAYVVLAEPDSQVSDDRGVHFLRLSTLSDPTSPLEALEVEGDGWPADDLDGWLENLSDDVRVSDRRDVMLGGLDATRFELELAGECEIGTSPCAVLGTNQLVNSKDLFADGIYRIWIVDQGDEDPLAVIAAVGRAIDRNWFDAADRMLSTLAFGEVAPNPISESEAGAIDLRYLGGIRIDLPEGSHVLTHPLEAVVLDGWPGETRFITELRTAADEPVMSVAALVQSLEVDQEATVTETATVTIGGVEARVFDIGRRDSTAELPDHAWVPADRGRIWAMQHPERGLLVITAVPLDNADIVFPLVLEQTEAILSTLEFTEPA